MKHLNSIVTLVALALLAAGCSKEEISEAPADEPTATVQEAATEAAESTTTENESLQVVEESAAEAEPEDQAIVLAKVDDVAATAARSWKYKEGENFTRLVPTQQTVGGADKIEVAEAFMYSCPHCFSLEPFVSKWVQSKDPKVRFVRIPVMFNNLAVLHGQLYYTEVFLAKNGKLKDPVAFRNMVFDEYHKRGNRLTSEAAIQRLFARAGVSEEDFQRTWKSFEVDQALRVAQDLARRYGINSVPTIIVNGKYVTDVAKAGGPEELFDVIDELTAREGLR